MMRQEGSGFGTQSNIKYICVYINYQLKWSMQISCFTNKKILVVGEKVIDKYSQSLEIDEKGER